MMDTYVLVEESGMGEIDCLGDFMRYDNYEKARTNHKVFARQEQHHHPGNGRYEEDDGEYGGDARLHKKTLGQQV